MIYKSIDAKKLNLNTNEALRYSMVQNSPTDEEKKILEACVKDVIKAAKPKAIYEFVPIKTDEEGYVDFGFFKTKSKNLKKNVANSKKAIIFAATLGYEVERLLIKSRLNSALLLLTNAAASALIEAFCTEVFSNIKSKLLEEGLFLRPRFSPGYGDFDLLHQKDFFSFLPIEKHLGITLTDDCFMIPSKSVTAISAISSINLNCELDGCEMCSSKSSCRFCRI